MLARIGIGMIAMTFLSFGLQYLALCYANRRTADFSLTTLLLGVASLVMGCFLIKHIFTKSKKG